MLTRAETTGFLKPIPKSAGFPDSSMINLGLGIKLKPGDNHPEIKESIVQVMILRRDSEKPDEGRIQNSQN